MADTRLRWKGRFEFVFASFGYTVGLGNLWRFPQKCYSNGGGVFLIPYAICVVLCAVPTLFIEFGLGQLKSEGCIQVWRFSPLVQGIGWATWFNVLMTVIYYNVMLMYALYYMLVAFVHIGTTLPWSRCRAEDDWSTSRCHSPMLIDTEKLSAAETIRASLPLMNSSCVAAIETEKDVTSGSLSVEEFRSMFSGCKLEFVTPEEEYWTRLVLGVHESDGFDDLGAVSGRNAILLLTMWVIVFYCCMRGIRSVAKIVYITATFPFLLILILLVRGTTLDGYREGIRFYMQPDWSKLSDLQIWSSAATQAIYSLGIAFGSHISLASHNKPNNNIFRDAILIGSVNSCVSLFGGFVIFSFLGHASKRLDRPVGEIFDHGPGILFISYVQGISQLPAASFWTFLFFLTVLTYGIDTQVVMVWTLYDSLEDLYPHIFRKRGKWILLAACGLIFILSLPLITEGGIHFVMLMDRYTSDFTLVLFVFVEVVVVCWVYGINRFISDLEQILGRKSKPFWWFWRFTWIVSCPVYAVFIFIASAIGYKRSSYAGVDVTPGGEAIGWLLILTPLIIMLAFGGFQVWKRGGAREALGPNDGGSKYNGNHELPGENFEPEPQPLDFNLHNDVPSAHVETEPEVGVGQPDDDGSDGYISPVVNEELPAPGNAIAMDTFVNLGFYPDGQGVAMDESSPPPTPCDIPKGAKTDDRFVK